MSEKQNKNKNKKIINNFYDFSKKIFPIQLHHTKFYSYLKIKFKSINEKFSNLKIELKSLNKFSNIYLKFKIKLNPFLRKILILILKIKSLFKSQYQITRINLQNLKHKFSQSKARHLISQHQPSRTMKIMLTLLIVLFGLIFLYKAIMSHLISEFIKSSSQVPVTVSAQKVQYQEWLPELKSSGSLRAVKGVNITTEIAGLVRSIYFQPGSEVSENDLIVKLNDETEKAQLASLIASYELAKINLERDQILFKDNVVSKSTLDTSTAQFQSAEAQVQQQQSIITKKNITAPFAGKLGVSKINPGQYLNPGDEIVTLQALDPIYLDFYIPQQYIQNLQINSPIKFTTNTYADRIFDGIITTVNPIVDNKTRNIEVEATIQNPDHLLYPGMYGNVIINMGDKKQLLTLPQTAVIYNPFGNIVFLVEDNNIKKSNAKKSDEKLNDKKINQYITQNGKKQPIYTVKQIFVETGERRGNQIAILKGLKEGDMVVTSGQMKLKNGSQIIINNEIQPNFESNPYITEEE